MNKIDKTICFFWVGDKIEIPQSLVQSIRLTMGDKINVVQLPITKLKRLRVLIQSKDLIYRVKS